MYGDLCRTGKGISMRNERKERNQQVEQRLLQDIEVFSSPQFLRLMQRVIRQIKRCLFRQIKTGLSEHLTMG